MDGEAKVLADSISPNGKRLTTLEVKFPRYVLAEFNTHRAFSRNSASSRAIPTAKMSERVRNDPFIGEHWNKINPKGGMQAGGQLTGEALEEAKRIWYEASQYMADVADRLTGLGLAKEKTNRLIENFTVHTVIVTATEWDNFLALRTHRDTQPELRDAALCMQTVLGESEPVKLEYGEWHKPLILPDEDFPLEDRIRISSGRCARVSYLTHAGVRDPLKDIDLYEDTLHKGGHMSPMEHVARPLEDEESQIGNFIGWHQHRADILHQENYGARPVE